MLPELKRIFLEPEFHEESERSPQDQA